MTEITCINDDKRGCLQIFKRPLPLGAGQAEETVFFGVIWTEKAKTAKEIYGLYQDVIDSAISHAKPGQEEAIFETCLQRINAGLEKYGAQKNSFNLLFGLKCKNKILFTQKGKIFSLLVDRKSANNIVVSPLANLLKNEENRFFPNFAAGNLSFHQSIFFSTDNISTYFTPVRLATLLFSSPNALWQIKDSVTKLDANLPFGALHLLYKEKEKTAENSLSSIKDLNATAAQTEKILTPPILPNFSPMFRKTGGILAKISRLIIYRLGRTIKKLSPIARAEAKKIFSFLRRGAKRGLLFILFKLKQLAINLYHRKYPSPFIYLIEKFNSLTFNGKLMAITLLTLIFLFTQSMVYLNYTAGTRANQKLVNSAILEIQNNLTEIKAAMIYGDENKARALLTAARTSFDALDKNSNFKEPIKNQLAKEIKNYDNLLRKLYTLQTKALFEFSGQKEPENLANLGADIYLLSDNSLLKLNQTKKSLDVVYQNLSLNFKYLAANGENKTLWLVDPDKKTAMEYLAKNQTSNEFKWPAIGQLINLKTYGQRIYALSNDPISLYRLTKNNQEFVSAAWLKEKVDLKNSVSLAVDGDVYVLKNSGEILKLQNGRLKNFQLSGLEPTLGISVKIFTDENSNFLYVWERENQRLAVFDKKGRLVAQYQTNNLAGAIKDFAIEEKTKKIYLLTDKGIFEAGLDNLK